MIPKKHKRRRESNKRETVTSCCTNRGELIDNNLPVILSSNSKAIANATWEQRGAWRGWTPAHFSEPNDLNLRISLFSLLYFSFPALSLAALLLTTKLRNWLCKIPRQFKNSKLTGIGNWNRALMGPTTCLFRAAGLIFTPPLLYYPTALAVKFMVYMVVPCLSCFNHSYMHVKSEEVVYIGRQQHGNQQLSWKSAKKKSANKLPLCWSTC